ncbi:similar to Saccharomyces cerevisiae YKL175W ZRT3 Vacuolar membrane zinc transporter [Geotrichum candidum]|uniref:Similar to Saccharomyces cerevisiae YKL175W ZRT3 Vacuolar membrane zinc transporter n=1 Tax=Geotrichum candidum TaxID=1173061 RepID=A0A0J9X3N9_GEOCN|nr:similar to Saccharomyces cerevisiae YKL175W ZRT3 Vacuolar membrane zinc transporter [Geotrichum candidum]
MIDYSQFSNDIAGLILCLASSVACVLGSLIITLDVVWRWFFPQSTFDLNNNQFFLVCSLSLSAGVLLFTSLYKLLPQGLDYFNKSELFENSPGTAQALLISTYILGVAICAAINAVIHALTSKSIVHCAHDGNPSEHISNESLTEDSITHKHSHTFKYPTYDSTSSDLSRYDGTHESPIDRTSEANISNENMPLLAESYHAYDPETTDDHTHNNTQDHSVHRKRSIMDMTQWTLRGKRYIGKCMGYGNVEDCCGVCGNPEGDGADPNSIIDYIEPETMVHRHIHFNNPNQSKAAVPGTTCSHEHVHSCSTPRELHHIHSHEGSILETENHTNYDQDEEANVGKDDNESEVHHHHVSTRYSHLFSIGLQTAFAISVHKIPEGFLMFATSHADRTLGFSVFLALAVHNVSEGFTIAFPLFLALQSRVLAITSAFVLGGLSQPLGALLAWGLFSSGLLPGNDDSINNGKTPFVFGLIVSITAGFLSIIGLQMYGTAISFGGNQTTTMSFAFLGIAIIGLSSSLSSH